MLALVLASQAPSSAASGDCIYGDPRTPVWPAWGTYDPGRPACLAAQPLSEWCPTFAEPGASGPCPTFRELVEQSGWLESATVSIEARRCVTVDGEYDVLTVDTSETWFDPSGAMVAREEHAPYAGECGGDTHCYACGGGVESMNAWWGTPIDLQCNPNGTVTYTRADFGVPATEAACSDGLDADLDQAVDCADPDCAGDGGCAPTWADGFVPTDLPAVVEGSTFGAPDSHAPAASGDCPGLGGSDRAFLFVAPDAGRYRFDTVGSTFDTYVYVLSAAGAELGCNDWFEFDVVNSMCVGTRPESELDVELVAGATVLVVVDGASVGESGDFVLRVDGPLPPRVLRRSQDREGCACTSGGAIGWTWCALVLPLLRRRRPG